ncbi:hypothetical protein Tco_1540388 [Tanacetum coccineum]
MDVDNQNKELNKEKDANETEDNDKMKNNEMKNDSIQEKQDAYKDENAEKEKVETEKEKQDKANKVDNVQEKQGDDKDEIGEDEFWNTQFTNSQCEDLETQAKEENSKEKKNMFSMHLKEVQHQRANDVLKKKPTILRPKWGTKKNNTDCGVFLMMHMENYNGENAKNWNLEFPTEEKGNRYDIIKMTMRFAAKMLTHDINIHREEMSKQALEFAEYNKKKKVREALIREAIRVKKEKQDSERVSSAI